MASSAMVCPRCRQLNSASEQRCFRCGAQLGGLSALFHRWSQVDFLATRILVGLCIANFLLMVLVGGGLPLAIFGRGPSLSTILQVGGIVGEAGSARETFRWLSAVFVHLGVLHLLMNMSALLWLGRAIEGAFGWWRMVIIFVLAGIGGFAVSRLYYGPVSPPTAGASGALFGLFGAQIAELHRRRDPRLKDLLFQLGAYTLAFALLFPVNNAAHVGGALSGLLVTKGLFRIPRTTVSESWGAKIGALLLLLCLASQVAAVLSPEASRVRQLEDVMRRRMQG